MIAYILVAAALLPRVHVAAGSAPAFRQNGVEVVESVPAGYTKVPPPNLEMHVDVASATSVPWIDSNVWRFLRGVQKALYEAIPAGKSALSAAEAYAFGVDAILEPEAADAEPLGHMISFLKRIDQPPMPALANIAMIDDGSDELGEVMNLMSRRNLLYRVVSKPDPSLDVNVRVGTPEYPRDAVSDPNEFAARVRSQLGDEKRLVRIYNTYTVLAHLNGDGHHVRVHLLNYGRRPALEVRVRVLGAYETVHLADSSDADEKASDVAIQDGGTEFTVRNLATYAVVDLEKQKR